MPLMTLEIIKKNRLKRIKIPLDACFNFYLLKGKYVFLLYSNE